MTIEEVKSAIAEAVKANSDAERAVYEQKLADLKAEQEAKMAEITAQKKMRYGKKMSASEEKEVAVTYFKALVRNDEKVLKDLSSGSDADGGYLVPEPIRNGIVMSAKRYGLARQFATVVPMTTETLDVPRLDTNVAFSGISQGAGYHVLNQQFGNTKLTAVKYGGILKITDELLADATVDMLPFIYNTFGRAMALTEDNVMFGAILADSDLQEYTLASGKTSFSDITFDDMLAITAMVDEGADDNARFVLHKTVLASVLATKASTAGTYLAGNPLGSQAGINIWNYPVSKSNVLPSTSVVSQANKPFMIYGNLANYIFGDRQALGIKLLSEKYADEGKIGLRVDERFAVGSGMPSDLVRVLTHA